MSAATLQSLDINALFGRFDAIKGTIRGAQRTERHLSDLAGIFLDEVAYRAACAEGNPLIYSVEVIERRTGDGDLHYGIGVISPGRIGQEYFMTKGHLHAWREAAELYVGLSGNGVILLEDEATGESCMVRLVPGCTVYVPGRTGHRTANVGDAPLSYLGVYPARAGHDHGVYESRNFRCAVVEEAGAPRVIRRG